MQQYYLLLVLLVNIMLSACSGVNFTSWHFPYMMEVQQGNEITQKQYEQLTKGMTKEQVVNILGSPLTQYIFINNRWDFVYQKYLNNKLQNHYSITIIFNNNIIDSIQSSSF